LEAILETGEPDWSARLAAAGTVLIAFPRQYRDTPEHVRELLQEALPSEVLDQVGMRERLDAERALGALRAEWLRLPKWSETRGLYCVPFPRAYVPPWLDYDKVCREEIPPDIPPDEAPVRRLPDGRVILDRGAGSLPMMLEPVQPDDSGFLRAPHVLG
jgi:hypothetical protein